MSLKKSLKTVYGSFFNQALLLKTLGSRILHCEHPKTLGIIVYLYCFWLFNETFLSSSLLFLPCFLCRYSVPTSSRPWSCRTRPSSARKTSTCSRTRGDKNGRRECRSLPAWRPYQSLWSGMTHTTPNTYHRHTQTAINSCKSLTSSKWEEHIKHCYLFSSDSLPVHPLAAVCCDTHRHYVTMWTHWLSSHGHKDLGRVVRFKLLFAMTNSCFGKLPNCQILDSGWYNPEN